MWHTILMSFLLFGALAIREDVSNVERVLDLKQERQDEVATRAEGLVSKKARQALLLAYWKDTVPNDEVKQILTDFRAFKKRLASSDTLFAQLCHDAAQQEGEVEISCGATLQCFLNLFDGERQSMKYNEVVKEAAQWQPDEAEHLMSIGSGPTELLATASTRQFSRDMAFVQLQKLSEGLLSHDEDSALPRIFDLHIEWNVILKKTIIAWNTADKFGMVNMVTRLCKPLLTELLKSLKDVEKELQPMVHLLAQPNACTHVAAMFDAPVQKALQQLFEGSASSVMVRHPGILPAHPGGKWEAKDLEAELSRQHVESACAEQLEHEGVKLPVEVPAGFSAFSEMCSALAMSRKPLWTADTMDGQNHVFAIVKKGNDNFSVVQGYISGKEPGYDLKGWLLSGNKFAAVDGFNERVMREFLGHLSTYVAKSAMNGAFDGDNHAATFLVREQSFAEKQYLGILRYSELGDGVEAGRMSVKDLVINPLVEEMDALTTGML